MSKLFILEEQGQFGQKALSSVELTRSANWSIRPASSNKWGALLGPVSRKSRERFGPEKPVVKLQSACFEKLIFYHVFSVRKTKRIVKFGGFEARCCEDMKGIVTPETGPKSFGTFVKQAPNLVS